MYLNAIIRDPENWTNYNDPKKRRFQYEMDWSDYCSYNANPRRLRLSNNLKVAEHILDLWKDCKNWQEMQKIWKEQTGKDNIWPAIRIIADQREMVNTKYYNWVLDAIMRSTWVYGQAGRNGLWTIPEKQHNKPPHKDIDRDEHDPGKNITAYMARINEELNRLREEKDIELNKQRG